MLIKGAYADIERHAVSHRVAPFSGQPHSLYFIVCDRAIHLDYRISSGCLDLLTTRNVQLHVPEPTNTKGLCPNRPRKQVVGFVSTTLYIRKQFPTFSLPDLTEHFCSKVSCSYCAPLTHTIPGAVQNVIVGRFGSDEKIDRSLTENSPSSGIIPQTEPVATQPLVELAINTSLDS